MKVIYKIWLANDRGRTFGEGPYRLLKEVRQTGSLLQAALSLGMAYSKARWLITSCERSLGYALTDRKAGGVSGGGSAVTPEGAGLMEKHEALCTEVECALGELYKKHFGQFAEVEFHKVWRRHVQ
jgi:molybdate transport system regulatory protein